MSVYFKTLENKTSIDADKNPRKIFPCIKTTVGKIALKILLT